jgi:hypothetical protein
VKRWRVAAVIAALLAAAGAMAWWQADALHAALLAPRSDVVEGVPTPDAKAGRAQRGRPALYDLAADPGGRRELRGSNAAVVSELMARLTAVRDAESSSVWAVQDGLP